MTIEIEPSAATRAAILDAAAAEFADHGVAGTRMEHIAARAGRNKALVYRHFGDKQALFEAVLEAQFQHREEILEGVPNDLGEALVYWFQATARSPEFLRLILREALEDEGEELVQESARRAYYRRQVEQLLEWQEDNGVGEELDPTYLFLALLALISYPTTFPQITRLVTGHPPDSVAFKRGWNRLLRGLGRKLEVVTAARGDEP